MIQSLIKEVEIRSKTKENDLRIIENDEKIETIYFGGGTPSLLSKEEINEIIFAIKSNYNVNKDVEITLEANPDDITCEKLNSWKTAGINRLSIGIQSFVERDLKWMNRVHNASQAYNCVILAREAGFNNFSIDLIFGTPGLTNEEWKQNVQKVIDFRVPHIACYALTVEKKTALQKMILLKKKQNIDSDIQAAQYSILMEMMHDAGYEHYEISNFAKTGFRSRHNSSYWQGKNYIGIGPSAHSYNGEQRMWNKANNPLYIQSLTNGIIPFEKETLTAAQKLEEYIMTSLRTIEGMDLNFIEDYCSPGEKERIVDILKNEVKKEQIIFNGNKVVLTDEGKLLADAITVKLFK